MEEETKQNLEAKQEEKNEKKKINICCLLSFIFSIVGLFRFGLPLGIASIVLGIIGIVKFKNDTEKYRWMGIVGLCIGIIDVISILFYVAILF